MRKLKKIFIIIAFAFLINLITVKAYAGEQTWKSLDYNVILNPDGSASIIETWNVKVSNTNTLFKDFDLSNGNYEFINVKVNEVINGEEIPLTKIYEQQYHVDSGCYYGMMIDSSTFEIAWNVGLDNSTAVKTYKMYYTVENAVKVYEDCTEFYWQFLSSDNTMTGDNITGKIYLPTGITDIERLHIWGHGDFSGNTERTSTTELAFDMNHISSNSMLEIRIVTEDNIFEESTNIVPIEQLDFILEEEAKWAEEANAKKAFYKILITILIIINLITFIIFLRKIIKYVQEGKELKLQKYPKNELKYFRDIPDEKNATPARASYMHNFSGSNSNILNNTSNIFSATILQLTLKKYISLEPIDKKNVRINFIDKEGRELLTKDEEIVYSILAMNSGSNGFVETNDLEKYAKKNYDEFYKLMQRMCNEAEKYEKNKGIIDNQRKAISDKWAKKGAKYLLFIVFSAFFAFIVPIIVALAPTYIAIIICMILCFKNSNILEVLTPEGYEESNRWKALENYMNDFSLLKEKQVPDLILWEKYLVYATTFGISKKVLDQLVKVYPQMMSEECYRSGQYSYLYIASNSGFDSISNMSKSFSDICKAANSAYSAAHSSSSGGGGGFSGGGGGRRRRWKLWRKIKKTLKSSI